MLKNKPVFTALLLGAFLAFSPCAVALPDSAPVETQNAAVVEDIDSAVDEAIQNSTKEVLTPHVEDIKEMTPNANNELKKEVVNDSTDTLKFTLKKFACAMLGVVISSIVIFLILFFMNKIALGQKLCLQKKENADETQQFDETSGINGENEALRVFLDETR